MAEQLIARLIFPPTIGDVDRVRVRLELPQGTEVLAIFQHAQLGAQALLKGDTSKPLQPMTLSAVREGVDLDVHEKQGHYRGTFVGLYRDLIPPPPFEGEPPPPPPEPPPPPRRDVWHVLELLTNPEPLPALEEV